MGKKKNFSGHPVLNVFLPILSSLKLFKIKWKQKKVLLEWNWRLRNRCEENKSKVWWHINLKLNATRELTALFYCCCWWWWYWCYFFGVLKVVVVVVLKNRIKQKSSYWNGTKQTSRRKRDPSEVTEIRDTLVQTFRTSITILNWKVKYIHQGHGVDIQRPCTCCFSLCEFI